MKRLPISWPRWSVGALLMSAGALIALLDDAISGEPLTLLHRGLDFLFMAVVFPLAVALIFDRYRRAQGEAAKAQAQAIADERLRISRDLHDSLAQQIGYLHLRLDSLASGSLDPQADAATAVAAIRRELEQMRAVSSEAYEQISGLLLELRQAGSPVLTEALLTRAKWVGARAGFDVNLAGSGEPRRLIVENAQQIQYIFREALSNVEKHAGARHVAIDVRWESAALTISLHDDGRGYDAESPLRPTHFGLEVMHERAARLGGELEVASAPGAGTTVTLSLPLAGLVAGENQTTPDGRESMHGRLAANGPAR